MNQGRLVFLLLLQLFFLSSCSTAQRGTEIGNSASVCAVYISSSGCPNCGAASEALLKDVVNRYPRLVIVEYEIYTDKDFNKPISDRYFSHYSTNGRRGVPFLILNKTHAAIGRADVLGLEEEIQLLDSNECPLPDATSKNFEDIDLAKMPGKIRIWAQNRVLIGDGTGGGDNAFLHLLLVKEDFEKMLLERGYQPVTPAPIPVSGGQIEFQHAVQMESWKLQWNGDSDL